MFKFKNYRIDKKLNKIVLENLINEKFEKWAKNRGIHEKDVRYFEVSYLTEIDDILEHCFDSSELRLNIAESEEDSNDYYDFD